MVKMFNTTPLLIPYLPFRLIPRINPEHMLLAKQAPFIVEMRGIQGDILAVQLVLHLVINMFQNVSVDKTPSLTSMSMEIHVYR